MNIAIVGGGPVGLTLAINLIYNKFKNKNFPKYDITIYEKRKKYTREQFIVFGGTKGNLLFNYPLDLRDILSNNFACYIDNPVVNMAGFCFRKDKNNYNIEDTFGRDFQDFSQTIEIKKLEKILLDYIKKKYKNINVIYKEFTKNDVDNYDIIVGADGQKSFVREKLMKSKWENLKDYKTYILHIKYTDLSNKKYKIESKEFPKKIKDNYQLKLKRKNFTPFNIRRQLDKKKFFEQDRFRLIRSNTNKTQFLLQLSKTEYNKIKNIKTFGKLPKKIQNSILIDSFIMGSRPTNLSNTLINIYNTKVGHSNKYAIIKNKKLFILIGDSAMTTHVFTGEGLNINFNLTKRTINSYVKTKKDDDIKEYKYIMNHIFKNNIYYKALLRYIPHKLLKSICSKITLTDIFTTLRKELKIYKYDDLVEDIKKKYKNISDNEIKNELCFILRDKILKYYTYKLNNHT